jgi:predicted metalloprotease
MRALYTEVKLAHVKWQRGSSREHIEDRRGMKVSRRGVALGGGGALVIIVVYLIGRALGVDLSGVLGGGGGGGGGKAHQPTQAEIQDAAKIDPATDPDALLVEFVTDVINDVQATFTKQVAEQKPYGGTPYRPATLVLFREATDTGCGQGDAAIGPFYCPPDEKAYIDLSFYKDLRDRFGAPGDFAQAYVLAHELGHHMQTVFGIDAEVRRKSTKANQNALSVRQELQADCFAGVWAHSARARDKLEIGDVKEAMDAATAIGDDRLQKMAGRKVNPETWTHGSSEMRVKWFTTGLESGRFAACDTFSPESP